MSSVKITNRPPEFDAIEYTGTNESEVAAFVGFLFKPSAGGQPPAVYDPIAQMLRPLPPGSWVVATGMTLMVYSASEFALKFIVVTH